MRRSGPLIRSTVALCLLCAASSVEAAGTGWQPSPGHTQVPIWPEPVAGGLRLPVKGTPRRAGADAESAAVVEAREYVAGRPWVYVSHVTRPTLTVYSPTGKNTGAAVIVFPGGGYQILAIDLEGTEVCDWLNSIGITAVLLKYRVPHAAANWEQFCGCDTTTRSSWALEDAQRAISLVRAHATEWHIDPRKIGVLGFSAGGHMVAAISTRFAERTYTPVDDADKESCRPDFAVAAYPGHLAVPETHFVLNPDIKVTSATPPTFLVQAEDDPLDPVENSLVYYSALRKARVPAEMHIYVRGGHAFGLRRTELPIGEWPQLVEKWLAAIGIIPK